MSSKDDAYYKRFSEIMKGMTREIKDLTNEQLFELFNMPDDYCDFSEVKNQLASRPDVHAMIVLDNLFPYTHYKEGEATLIECVHTSQIWFFIKGEDFKKRVTIEMIRDLIRCGLTYNLQEDRFSLILAASFHRP